MAVCLLMAFLRVTKKPDIPLAALLKLDDNWLNAPAIVTIDTENIIAATFPGVIAEANSLILSIIFWTLSLTVSAFNPRSSNNCPNTLFWNNSKRFVFSSVIFSLKLFTLLTAVSPFLNDAIKSITDFLALSKNLTNDISLVCIKSNTLGNPPFFNSCIFVINLVNAFVTFVMYGSAEIPNLLIELDILSIIICTIGNLNISSVK